MLRDSRRKEAAQPTVELPSPLARVLTDFEAAWRDGDARALSELFAEDGFVLPSWSPPIRGRELIEEGAYSSRHPLRGAVGGTA